MSETTTKPPKVRPAGRKLLWAALRQIDREPRSLEMGAWLEERGTPCGTVACLAGHLGLVAGISAGHIYYTGVLSGEVPHALLRRLMSRKRYEDLVGLATAVHLPKVCAAILGVSLDEANRIFVPDFWPDDLTTDYRRATIPDRPAVLRRRVHHWLKTGE